MRQPLTYDGPARGKGRLGGWFWLWLDGAGWSGGGAGWWALLLKRDGVDIVLTDALGLS